MIAPPPDSDEYDAATYGESFADVYDDWYGDITDGPATVASVVELAAGGRVLELGVGTGRLALPLAAAGADVVGVDASPAMLDLLAAKPAADTIPLHLLDMATIGSDPELARRGPFSVVFAAFNTFFNLPDDDAQRACLDGAAHLLSDDGVLAVEGFVPPAGGLADGGVSVREVTADAAVLTVSRHDLDAQVIRGHHIEIRAEGNRLRPWRIHYRTPAQLDASAAAAGFVLLHRWADWAQTPFAAHDTHVSIYRREPS